VQHIAASKQVVSLRSLAGGSRCEAYPAIAGDRPLKHFGVNAALKVYRRCYHHQHGTNVDTMLLV